MMNQVFIAGCRALGLIDKIVTGPLWRRLEESYVSVLEMRLSVKLMIHQHLLVVVQDILNTMMRCVMH